MINEQLKQMAELVKAKYSALIEQGVNVNTLILAEYQEATGAQEFKTFKAWKEEGKMVKKGEKGFPIFSRPIKKIKEEQTGEQQEGRGYFGTAYVFNNMQVEEFTPKTK